MNILFIGGTGEISRACVEAALDAGHQPSIFNRGLRGVSENVEHFRGDLSESEPYRALADKKFDVVCQFLAFEPNAIKRDIEFFKSRCEQYIFISTASAYEKPPSSTIITESTKLTNPYWEYSRKKIACEEAVRELCDQHNLAFTIVRPSHTYRTRIPGAIIDGDHQTWRMQQGKPVIVHGDGQSLWALTYASDFATAFIRLFCNELALNNDFHITNPKSQSWEVILNTIGEVINDQPNIKFVSTTSLIAQNQNWQGPLLGDKANSVIFDNAKVVEVIGGWHCEIDLQTGIEKAWQFAQRRLEQNYAPDPELDKLIDRIIAET